MLTLLEHLPESFLTVVPTAINTLLPDLSLIHLRGSRQPALFVSVLLHGNETTGLLAIQNLLKRYSTKPLPRDLILLIGNVTAAREGQRHLDSQLDFNRIWPVDGQPSGDSDLHQRAQAIFEYVKHHSIFGAVDVHNNTGRNPHYACITRTEPQFLQLANLFGQLIVHFTHPRTLLAAAFAELAPATVLECGQPNLDHGTQHAADYLDACLHLAALSDHIRPQDISLYHTVATVKIPSHIRFGFGNQPDPACDLMFATDLDRFNFSELKPGTPFAMIQGTEIPLEVCYDGATDVRDRYFSINPPYLEISQAVMPAMLTLDPHIIQQDCLCYLMERMFL